MVITGNVSTVTTLSADAVQPLLSVPVTVYAPAVFTVIVEPEAPLLQTYVLAPEAVRVVLVSWQKEISPMMVIVGNGLTVRAKLVVAEHCSAEVAVTVYVPPCVTFMLFCVLLLLQT